MHTQQCVTRVLQVIELCSEPGIHRVAVRTRGAKAERNVVDDRSPVISLVAGETRR